MEKMLKKCRNAWIKLKYYTACFFRRRKLKYKDFTILSNNCWGGFIYQMFHLPYNTPTIGLMIMERDYVKFLADLDHYLEEPLVFIPAESSKYYAMLTKTDYKIGGYPVALLDDIEIHFVHYSSEEEAKEKWNRRKARINKDRLLIKLSERNDCDAEVIRQFHELPYANKICFTEQAYPAYPECIQVEALQRLNRQGGDETQYTLEKIDIYQVLNGVKA